MVGGQKVEFKIEKYKNLVLYWKIISLMNLEEV